VKIIFVKDKFGQPVLDKEGKILELDLGGDVEKQLKEKFHSMVLTADRSLRKAGNPMGCCFQ